MHMESLRKLTLEYAKRKEAIDYTDLNLRLRETLLNVREAELDRREAVAAQVRAEANSNSFTGFSEAEI